LNNPLGGSLDKNTSAISNSSSNGTGSGSTSAPQYAEIYAASATSAQQHQQSYQSTNPYATTGLFVNQNNGVAAALIKNAIINSSTNGNPNCNLNVQNITDNPYNVLTYQTSNNSRAIAMPLQTVMTDSNGKYSSYTIKIINDKICIGSEPNNGCNQHQTTQQSLDEATLNTLSTLNALSTLSNSLSMSDQKKLLNYLQATQSQTNTPRVMVKNLHNKVKSCEGGHQQQQYLNEPVNENLITMNTTNQFSSPQLSRQLVNYLAANNGSDSKNTLNSNNNSINSNNNAKNMLVDMILQQQQQQLQQQQSINSSSTPIPSLPAAPPPSLATALFAHQQYHHQQNLQPLQQPQSQQLMCNHFARPDQSPVHYNSPWNVNIDPAIASTNNNNLNSAIVLNRVNPNQTSSAKMLSMANASGTSSNNTTLPKNTHLVPSANSSFQPIPFSPQHQQQTSFTRGLANGKPQYIDFNCTGSNQQDYSSISPEDELNEVEMKLSEFYRGQQQQQQQKPLQHVNQILKSADSLSNNNKNNINIANNNNNSNLMQYSWTSATDSASNPMSGSYDSRNQTSSCDHSNSSELFSKHSSNSEDALSTHQPQQLQEQHNYMTMGPMPDVETKQLVKRNTKQTEKEIKNKQIHVASAGYHPIGREAGDELYISEMPQTIL
jgi:hypothetical protein